MVVGGGFEPPKLSRQIYSLIPLAAREPHQILAFWQCLYLQNREETNKNRAENSARSNIGAPYPSRTDDLLITSQLLYQLS